MKLETIGPAYNVGDRVYWHERQAIGTVTICYEGSGVPRWYGTRRITYTHCYAVRFDSGRTVYGLVDADLTAAQEVTT